MIFINIPYFKENGIYFTLNEILSAIPESPPIWNFLYFNGTGVLSNNNSIIEFEEMIKNDLLLEYAEVYGNYYGTPKEQVLKVLKSGKNVVLEIDPQGAMQVKAKFPEGVFIYILPPSLDELAARITKRGTDSKDSIKKRLAAATEEIQYALKYDYVVVNDKVETAVDSIATIISAEKFNSKRRKKIILNICESEKLKHD